MNKSSKKVLFIIAMFFGAVIIGVGWGEIGSNSTVAVVKIVVGSVIATPTVLLFIATMWSNPNG